MGKRKREEFEDDGRTIANMNVDGMPWYLEKREKQPEQEEELEVEDLLQSMQESELEDIDLTEVSETRKMIEKFVDENPEAVANLLRNWLNEDWG